MVERLTDVGTPEWMAETIAAYDLQAPKLAAAYAAYRPKGLTPWWSKGLPTTPTHVIDVGAGVGLDATWLAARGHSVVAVEPAQGMRRVGEEATRGQDVEWIADALPDLNEFAGADGTFDFALCNAVIQHLPDPHRARALDRLLALLSPHGRCAISLREGPAPEGRPMFKVTEAEILAAAAQRGFVAELSEPAGDPADRPGVSWRMMILAR
jgi:2-polyprenyl-3-methyl-5-hydroxy-6-metoxy-1,4-benzoquinol methylase